MSNEIGRNAIAMSGFVCLIVYSKKIQMVTVCAELSQCRCENAVVVFLSKQMCRHSD